MAGRTIRICPPRTFTFDGLEGGTAAQKITIAERIDCSQYEIAELIVRVVGAVSTGVSPAKIEVILVSDGFTPDDPSQDFFSDDALATVSFSYLANGYPAGTLKIASAADLGSMLAVQVVGTPAATTGTLSGRLAIDLALKTN